MKLKTTKSGGIIIPIINKSKQFFDTLSPMARRNLSDNAHLPIIDLPRQCDSIDELIDYEPLPILDDDFQQEPPSDDVSTDDVPDDPAVWYDPSFSDDSVTEDLVWDAYQDRDARFIDTANDFWFPPGCLLLVTETNRGTVPNHKCFKYRYVSQSRSGNVKSK